MVSPVGSVRHYFSAYESDAERRRTLLRTLWQEHANHLARTLEAVGHAGIEKRAADVCEKRVKEKGPAAR